MPDPSFKERYRDLQELVREHHLLRTHNLRIQPGDAQDTLLLFAEAALIFLILERFLRAILAEASVVDSTRKDVTLKKLLEMATVEDRKLLRLPWPDQQEGIKKISEVRNTLLHGNFEQAARGAGCASTEDYFRKQFAPEIEGMNKVVENLFCQIDPATGKPYAR